MRLPPVPVLVLGAAGFLLLVALWLFQTSPAAEARRDVERRQTQTAESGAVPDVAAGLKAPPVVTVDALTVRSRDARTIVDMAGILEPVRDVVVGAEVAGRVIAIEAEEHTSVEEGSILVRLDPDLPRAAVERARAALLRAEAGRGLAAADLTRGRELSKRQVVSAAELDRAESEAQSTEAQVAEARAALVDAETRLAKTEIRAPFAGVVSRLDLEPGAYVSPGDPVAELSDLSQVEIEVGVSDQEILAIRDGDRVKLSVEALPGRWFEGRVWRPGRTTDAQTRKYPVPVRVANPQGLLLPGMLGTVRFELGKARQALRIPRRSVQREFDLEYLYILEPLGDDGDQATAHRRRVATRPVPFHPELLEVTEGVIAGERVAVSGLRELRDGIAVRVRELSLAPSREARP
jgi:membrane fusion protein (multidrug efflux system)